MLDTSTLAGFRRSDGFLYPDYERFGLLQVPAAVRGLLGGARTPLRGVWPGGSAKRVMLLLADGFGYSDWQRYADALPFFRRMSQRGMVCPITTVFPSTTAAAITTLHSGLSPLGHGLLEWFVYFDEVDAVFETLPFEAVTSPERRPESSLLFSDRTLYEQWGEEVRAYHVMPAGYAYSDYTRRVTQGAVTLGCASLSEQLMTARSLLERGDGPCYVYVHWGGIDGAAHRYGPGSQAHREAMGLLSEVLDRELGGRADDALIVVTADHGVVAVDPSRTVYLNKFAPVVNGLAAGRRGKPVPPWGNTRDLILRVRDEALADVKGFLAEKLAGQAMVMETAEAFRQGLFGPGEPDERARRRAGNLLVLMRGGHTVWWDYGTGQRFGLVGMHGSLTEQEMLVPFAVSRLSDLTP